MKNWIKRYLWLSLVFVIFVPLSACTSRNQNNGVSGTYSATGQGIGEMKVTITFRDGKIDNVDIDGKDETESIGGAAIPTLVSQLKEKNSPEIDGVSGATWTSEGVREAARKIFEEAGISYEKSSQ